jgi:two-component system, chemotaxis family, response regulator Rcp1
MTDALDRQLHIVLMEDNPADVYLIREALKQQKLNFELSVIADGQEALAFINGNGKRPDLILLDLNIPKHDGREILQRIREHPQLSQIPVAVLTSSESPRDRKDVERLGATRYIAKPLNLNDFMAIGALVAELL